MIFRLPESLVQCKCKPTVPFAYDNECTAFLNSQGYRVMRFWNNDILQNTEAVLQNIFRSGAGRIAQTLTLPRGGQHPKHFYR